MQTEHSATRDLGLVDWMPGNALQEAKVPSVEKEDEVSHSVDARNAMKIRRTRRRLRMSLGSTNWQTSWSSSLRSPLRPIISSASLFLWRYRSPSRRWVAGQLCQLSQVQSVHLGTRNIPHARAWKPVGVCMSVEC
jgi:hypothetical protein